MYMLQAFCMATPRKSHNIYRSGFISLGVMRLKGEIERRIDSLCRLAEREPSKAGLVWELVKELEWVMS